MPYPQQPKETPIPPELDRWNWGAFLLNGIWGIGNSTYIALLMFVPIVNLVMIFILGAKGSKWAWKNRIWADKEHFIRTQRNWARAGILIAVGMVLFVGLSFYGLISIMKSSDAYKLSMVEIRASQQIIETMGEPIQSGWFVIGNIRFNGSDGSAELSIPISGPKCSGNAISRSTKREGVWEIYLLIMQLNCQSVPIVLINTNNLIIPNSSIGA